MLTPTKNLVAIVEKKSDRLVVRFVDKKISCKIMDSEKLIELVRENAALYDMSHKNYCNTLLKNKLWNKIGAKLNMRGTDCKKCWVGLRDTYRRAVKRRRAVKSEQAAVKLKVWKYEEHLSFLEPHMQERETKSSLHVTATSDNAEEMEESFLTSDKVKREAETLETPPYFSRKTRSSGIRSFLMSMADTAEKFSELNQYKVKSKIFSIISEIEFDEVTNRSNAAKQLSSSSNSLCCKVKSSPSIGRCKSIGGWNKNLRFD